MKLHSAKVQLDGFASNLVVRAAKQQPAQRVTNWQQGAKTNRHGERDGAYMYDGGADAGKIGQPMVWEIRSECTRATW